MKTKHHSTAATTDDRPPSTIWPTLWVYGGLAVVALLVMLYVVQDAPQQEVAHKGPAPPQMEPVAVPSPPPAEAATPPQPAEPEPEPVSEPPAREPEQPEPFVEEPPAADEAIVATPAIPSPPPPSEPVPSIPDDDETESAPVEPEPTLTRPGNMPDEDSPDVTSDEAGEPEMSSDPEPSVSSPSAATGPGIPDKPTIVAKSKEIKQIFKADYTTRDPAVRAALAQRLAKDAQTTFDDPITAYVLATEAREQALQCGDYDTYVSVGRFLTERYGVDTHDDDIAAFGKLQNLAGKSAGWYRGLLREIGTRVDELCERDEFDRAIKYANVAKGIAVKAADTATAQEWTARIKDLVSMKTQFAGYKAAKEAVLVTPADPTAHSKWGIYLCLVKGDFAAGLSSLAKGDDAVFAGLAKREANPRRDATETVALADEWYALGEKSKAFRTHAWRHAGELYQAARPHLAGLAATKVQKRLDEIASAVTPRAIGGNTVEKLLAAEPWSVKWEQPVRRRDGGNENEHEWSHEETITFHEGGRVDSRYFDRFEIGADFIALYAPAEEGVPPFAGGPPFDRNRDRRTQGRARLVGGELQFLVFRGDRMENPRNRGMGTRQKTE